jgi:hypothetical protein
MSIFTRLFGGAFRKKGLGTTLAKRIIDLTNLANSTPETDMSTAGHIDAVDFRTRASPRVQKQRVEDYKRLLNSTITDPQTAKEALVWNLLPYGKSIEKYLS